MEGKRERGRERGREHDCEKGEREGANKGEGNEGRRRLYDGRREGEVGRSSWS
jgi:hypothetical protein